MRFSPTLLACCTAATLFGLPVLAADATDVAESLTTDGGADDTALLVETTQPTEQLPETDDAQGPSQLQPAAGDVDSKIEITPVPDSIPREFQGLGPEPLGETDPVADPLTADIRLLAQDAVEAPGEISDETPGETLDRLLNGIGQPPESVPVEAPDEVPAPEAPAVAPPHRPWRSQKQKYRC